MSPFDFVKAINNGTDIVRSSDYPDLTIEEYVPFLTNKAFSYHIDSVMYANELNINNGIDKLLQYDFYRTSLRPAKRFSAWAKKGDPGELDVIKDYYQVSYQKAAVIRDVLTHDQIGELKDRLIKGG